MRSTDGLTERNSSNSNSAGVGSSCSTSCCSASTSTTTSRTTLLLGGVEEDMGDIIILPDFNENNNKKEHHSSSFSGSCIVQHFKRRPKRTLLVGAGLLLVVLMSIQTSLFKQRSLSGFLSPFVFSNKYKDSIHTNPNNNKDEDGDDSVISWTMTPIPFEEPTYLETYNRAYQCRATPPNWKPKNPFLKPRLDLRDDVKSQVWFHTSIETNLNILVMGDSVAMQIGELLQEAMNIDPKTRTVLRLLEPGDDLDHESLFWGTSSASSGGSGGYRLLHWWLRRNHGKPLPETSGGGWILEDVDQLLELISKQQLEHQQRHGPRRNLRQHYNYDKHGPRRHHHHHHHHSQQYDNEFINRQQHHRRIEDSHNSKQQQQQQSESESEEEEEEGERQRHRPHPRHDGKKKKKIRPPPPPPSTNNNNKEKKRRDPRADAKDGGRRPRPGTTTNVKGSRPPPPPPTPPTRTSYTTKTSNNNNMRTGPPPPPPHGAKQQQQQQPRPKRVVLPKANVASDFRTKHHDAGTKVDVLIFRVSQPWMHWSTMTPDNMSKTIDVAKELLGVKVVVFLTIPYSNNIVNRHDIQQMSQTNKMIRQFVTQRQQQQKQQHNEDDVTVLYLDMARLTDTLLKENAIHQGYNVKEEEQETTATTTGNHGWSSSSQPSLPWPIDNYDFTLDTLVQRADYYSHSIAHVCGDRVLPNSEDCNNRNMLTVDGQHLCMKTFGGRFFAGMACVIRCAYTYDNNDRSGEEEEEGSSLMLDCQRACNDQYMTLQPLEDSFMSSQQ